MIDNDKRKNVEGSYFSCLVLPDHSRRQLDDRPCRNRVRCQRPLPGAGRARDHGAVGRADGRRGTGAARSGATPAWRRVRRSARLPPARLSRRALRRHRWCWPRRPHSFSRNLPTSRSIHRSPAVDWWLRLWLRVSPGLIVDSIVFLWLAFGSLEFLLGQIVGKLWMVLLAVPFVAYLRRRDERLGLKAA